MTGGGGDGWWVEVVGVKGQPQMALCHVVTGGVKLAVLSSKSDSTFVDNRVQGTHFAILFLCPICSHS